VLMLIGDWALPVAHTPFQFALSPENGKIRYTMFRPYKTLDRVCRNITANLWAMAPIITGGCKLS